MAAEFPKALTAAEAVGFDGLDEASSDDQKSLLEGFNKLPKDLQDSHRKSLVDAMRHMNEMKKSGISEITHVTSEKGRLAFPISMAGQKESADFDPTVVTKFIENYSRTVNTEYDKFVKAKFENKLNLPKEEKPEIPNF